MPNKPSLDLLKNLPVPDFLEEENKVLYDASTSRVAKHDKTYLKFCHWAALPTKQRNPPTQEEFELKYGLPHKYTTKFKARKDFQSLRIKYFWEWMFDNFPDVVYSIYQRAKTSTADAKIFVDLIGKRLERREGKEKMQPLMILGVPQEKIDNLFVRKDYHPENYDGVVNKTIQTFKIEDGEAVEDGP